MTKEEILAMEAGGYLNEKVGQEIFKELPSLTAGGYNAYPLYSIDIEAAWRLFEKTDFDAIWRLVGIPKEKSRYCVGYARGEMSDLICYTRDKNPEDCLCPICDSFPEAISKAALLAELEIED